MQNTPSIQDSRLTFFDSYPAGNMIISTYAYFAPLMKTGHVLVEVTKDTQDGKLIDKKTFEFKSHGDYPILNGSNESYRKASDKAHKWAREEANLWRNKKHYDSLTLEEIEEYRKKDFVFWDDENIRKRNSFS